ncbi:hypothetical protein ACFW04_003703 [Cataglyphis niger]
MRKWNLKFSGARGEDTETFLMPDEDILRSLPFFLSGIALHWFRGIDYRRGLCFDLRGFALRNEIIRRTQREQEFIADYLTCLRAMSNDRLSRCAGMRWTIEDAIEDVVTRIEASHQLAQRYRAEPTPDKSLFPDLVYRSPRHVNKSAHRQDTIAALNTLSSSIKSGAASRRKKRRKDHAAKTSTDRASVTSSTTSTQPLTSGIWPSRVSTAKCWNCEGIGHLSRDCEAVPRMYCYRCGRTEVTLRICPDCSGKE